MIEESILNDTSHRPWSLPETPWVMFQQWSDLLFAHWRVPAEVLRPRIPEGLELDTFGGSGWVSITPFRMSEIRFRGLPGIPGASHFLEMNLRTYVRDKLEGKAGILFFSLDASNVAAVVGARVGFGLPYYLSDMNIVPYEHHFHYTSSRRLMSADVDVQYGPKGDVMENPAALDLFLTERYCLYEKYLGNIMRTEIHHRRWILQPAQATFAKNTLGAAHDLPLNRPPDMLQFSRTLNVLIYPPSLAGVESGVS